MLAQLPRHAHSGICAPSLGYVGRWVDGLDNSDPYLYLLLPIPMTCTGLVTHANAYPYLLSFTLIHII
jgi:hypothetical protein